MTPKCHVVLSVCLVFFGWGGGGWEERWGEIQFTGGINFFTYIFTFFSVENSKVTMKKAQEDLAKARKLIRSMRSLEKSVPKSSLSCTEDKGLRLHQMAKKNNDKEKLQWYVKMLC